MNRRAFITSLLATTAAIPLARVAPLLSEPMVQMRFTAYGGGFTITEMPFYAWDIDEFWETDE